MEIILENEEKCSEKMKQDSPYNRSGTDTVHGNPCDADVISACWVFYIGLTQEPEACKHFLLFLLVLQVCTAVVTGMAGCVGTIHQLELMPPKSALIILATLTPLVSCGTLLISLTSHNKLIFTPLRTVINEICFNHVLPFRKGD